jgi:hypothetical protein
MKITEKDGDTLPLFQDRKEVGQVFWLVLGEDGVPLSCLVEIDTDAGYVIQLQEGGKRKKIEGKFRVVVNQMGM